MTEQGTVLVADDLPQNVRLLDAILSPLGYSVITASSGGEALAKIAASPPDLVLLDIVMPDIDGYEVCRRLRADPATSFLPVVMITASGARSGSARPKRARTTSSSNRSTRPSCWRAFGP